MVREDTSAMCGHRRQWTARAAEVDAMSERVRRAHSLRERALPANIGKACEVRIECQDGCAVGQRDRGDPGIGGEISGGAGTAQQVGPETCMLFRFLDDPDVRMIQPGVDDLPGLIDPERVFEQARLRGQPQEGIHDHPEEPDGAVVVDGCLECALRRLVLGKGGADGGEQYAGIDDSHFDRPTVRRMVSSSRSAAIAFAFVMSKAGRARSRVFCSNGRRGRGGSAMLCRSTRLTRSERERPSFAARVLSSRRRSSSIRSVERMSAF